ETSGAAEGFCAVERFFTTKSACSSRLCASAGRSCGSTTSATACSGEKYGVHAQNDADLFRDGQSKGFGSAKLFSDNISGRSPVAGIGSCNEGSARFLAEDEGFSEKEESFSV
ncbi:MAG: hypothetical protein IKQ24_04695, partial [Verrucomicrobia bacterium]|nr:hypothetical protein [Verrucomicrobiota bacterium]